MATDSNRLPLFPSFSYLTVVSVVERVRGAVIRHSGTSSPYTSLISTLAPPPFLKKICVGKSRGAHERGVLKKKPVGFARVYVGLDDINHLGLGGALWRAGTVLGYGVHRWHHRGYVLSAPPPPLVFSFRVCGRGFCPVFLSPH